MLPSYTVSKGIENEKRNDNSDSINSSILIVWNVRVESVLRFSQMVINSYLI